MNSAWPEPTPRSGAGTENGIDNPGGGEAARHCGGVVDPGARDAVMIRFFFGGGEDMRFDLYAFRPSLATTGHAPSQHFSPISIDVHTGIEEPVAVAVI